LPLTGKQRDFDIPLCDQRLLTLKGLGDERDSTRLSIISGPCRGAEWINAVPIRNCGLQLNDQEIRINIGLRLGADIVANHNCKFCSTQVDHRGTHGLSCRFSQGRFSRHAECNDIIHRALNTSKIPSGLEPIGILRNDGKRPDGVTYTPWSKGMCLAWDFTCVDGLAASRIGKTIQAATEAETRKAAKYSGIRSTHLFAPVACCTLGSWGESSLRFLKELGRKIAAVTQEPRAGYYLRQRLSVAIARGNATAVLGAIEQDQKLVLPL